MLNKLPIISIKELSYTYPNSTEALRNVNMNIYESELIGIMGKNGAGKTTLIRTLNGLIQPTKGSIFINGEIIKNKSIATLSKEVGIIFQNPSHQLFANSVEEEIKFSLKSLNLNKEELNFRVDKILKDFNLEKYRKRSPLNLSGGESKKLALASIICRDPKILVFDEPTLGQDAKEINMFINLIKNERKKGKTIIIITHNVEFAFEYIPRIILMTEGQIIADGPTSKVLNNEILIEKTSLILPQTRQFVMKLKESGFPDLDNLISKNQIIDYLMKFIRKEKTFIKGI